MKAFYHCKFSYLIMQLFRSLSSYYSEILFCSICICKKTKMKQGKKIDNFKEKRTILLVVINPFMINLLINYYIRIVLSFLDYYIYIYVHNSQTWRHSQEFPSPCIVESTKNLRSSRKEVVPQSME